jgi:hypothetical protein
MRTDEATPTDRPENESPAHDYMDEQEAGSFPSSDPHSHWAVPGQAMSHHQATPTVQGGATRGGELK